MYYDSRRTGNGILDRGSTPLYSIQKDAGRRFFDGGEGSRTARPRVVDPRERASGTFEPKWPAYLTSFFRCLVCTFFETKSSESSQKKFSYEH